MMEGLSMKLLIKQCFKTLFTSKIFSLILMVIIFISSLTYTFLQTSTNAFRKSYDALIHQGQLHDLVVKEFYKNDGDFQLTITEEHDPHHRHRTKYFVEVVMNDADPKKNPTGDYKTYFDQKENKDQIR